MQRIYNWNWVEMQVSQTVDVWNDCASQAARRGRRYNSKEQQQREKAFDQALQAVEGEVKRAAWSEAERGEIRHRVMASFARFCVSALDLEDRMIELLSNGFLPVGTTLAHWARQFDPGLSMSDIIQACRNAWTACGLQPLLGLPVRLTPSILGYSLLYPYTDNYLDGNDVSAEAKFRFSERFRSLLRGEFFSPQDDRDAALRALVELIETQYPRALYPDVFDCLLAIHRAQEQSITQATSQIPDEDAKVLSISCAKGGTSVVADACLAYGRLTAQERRFAFDWGVLLQLGDDLQDVKEDMRHGSVTLFSRAAGEGRPLDALAIQLLHFSERVGVLMDRLPHGAPIYKDLLKMSWRSLIIRAVADSHAFFSRTFAAEAELCSPFRFGFLRERRERLTGRSGLYVMLFDAFLEAGGREDAAAQLPDWREYVYREHHPVAGANAFK